MKTNRYRRGGIRNLFMALSKYDNFYFECKDMGELVDYYKGTNNKEQRMSQRDVVILVSRKMKELYQQYKS